MLSLRGVNEESDAAISKPNATESTLFEAHVIPASEAGHSKSGDDNEENEIEIAALRLYETSLAMTSIVIP